MWEKVKMELKIINFANLYVVIDFCFYFCPHFTVYCAYLAGNI